jgi:uncharacterized protein (UPF0303 family)
MSPATFTSAELAAQERKLQLVRFGHEEAIALGMSLVGLARERELPVAIGVDIGDHRVFRASMPGTCGDHDRWLDRKFAAVRRFDRCSLELELRTRVEPGYVADRGFDAAAIVLVGGGFPLRIAGVGVGVVGVAGLDSADDHALTVEALTAFIAGA